MFYVCVLTIYLGIVWQMRKERVWMVQTEQQYICIHQCLLAVLEGRDNAGPAREIHENPGFEGKNKFKCNNCTRNAILLPKTCILELAKLSYINLSERRSRLIPLEAFI